MSKVDRDKKIEKLMEKFRSYAKKRQDDPKTRKAAQADFEMLRAVHEGGQISKEESFARGFIASFIGALGKGEKAEKASSRGLGFLHMWMINAASAKAAGNGSDEKLDITPESLVATFNAEMDELGAPLGATLVAEEDGDNIEISTWDTGEDEDA